MNLKKKILSLEEEMENLPDIPRANTRVWTAEQDRLILKWTPLKGAPAVAAVLSIPATTIRKRWRELRDRK